MRIAMLALVALAACADPEPVDADLDGASVDVDCDDQDGEVHPGAVERCNGIDDDCDLDVDEGVSLTFFVDGDDDGFGAAAVLGCEAGEGEVEIDGDCDDERADVHPGAVEVCDEVDNDCNGEIDEGVQQTFYRDQDRDGYGSIYEVYACTLPEGASERSDDCNDNIAEVFPGAEELCNYRDDDCDTHVDEGLGTLMCTDADFDGYGDGGMTPQRFCPGDEPDEGWVANCDDCDDETAASSPAIGTDACDGEDNDCDGDIDEDHKVGWRLITLYSGSVYEVDPSTGKLTELATGEFNATSVDVREDGFAVAHHKNRLAELDVCAESWDDIGPTGVGAVGGISFHGGGVLVGLDSTNDRLVEFDTSTGAGRTIGGVGFDVGNDGLAWDCANDILYGVDANTDQLFTVDPRTGATSDFKKTGVNFVVVGLEYDAVRGWLWASTGDTLYTIDPASGTATFVARFTGGSVNDLAFYPSCPP